MFYCFSKAEEHLKIKDNALKIVSSKKKVFFSKQLTDVILFWSL